VLSESLILVGLMIAMSVVCIIIEVAWFAIETLH